MNIDYDKLKQLLLKDDEAMRYLTIIAILYSIEEDEEDKQLTYSDYEFFDFVIKAYYKDERITEYLNKEENKKFKKEVEAFYYIIKDKEKILETFNIETMLLQYDFLNYFDAIATHFNVSRLLYFANKYKKTSFEKKVNEYLLTYVNINQLKQGLDVDTDNPTKEEMKILIDYHRYSNYYLVFKSFNYRYSEEIGELSKKAFFERVNSVKEGNDYYFNKWVDTYLMFMKLVENGLDKEGYTKLGDTLEEELVRNIKEHCKNAVDDAKNYDDISKEFIGTLKRIAEEENIDMSLTDEENDIIKDKVLNAIKNIEGYTKEERNSKDNVINYFSELAFNDDLKPFLIDNIDLNLIDDEDLKNVIKEPKKASKKEFNRLDFALTDEVIKATDEYLKVNNSPYSRDILNARENLITYQETDIDRQEKELEELKERSKKNKSKILLEEIKLKEKDIEKNKEKFNKLLEDIAHLEKEIRDLQRLHTQAEDEETKKEYLKLIKTKDKKLKELKVIRDRRGINTQLNLFNNDLEVINKSITLSINYDNFDIANYDDEGRSLLIYLQNQLYYNPDNDMLVIDPDEYLEQTGRKSGYRVIRKKIEKILTALWNESYTINYTDKEKDREIKGQFRLIQSRIEDKYKGKKTFYVKLSDDYKKILLNDKAFQWASIPLLLNQLNQTPVEKRAKAIGFYLYLILKNDLKNQDIDGVYYKKFKMKTLVNEMYNKGLDLKKDKYAQAIIKPLEEALNILHERGILTYKTRAFLNYYGEIDIENNKEIKGTLGSSENKIKTSFENEDILIEYLIADYKVYNEIIKKTSKKRISRKKKDK